MTPQTQWRAFEVPKVHMVIQWYWFSENILLNTCGSLSYSLFVHRGFCFFNSVAIAAKQLQHKLNVSKILIVDWVRTQHRTSITVPHMARNKQTNTHMFLSVYLCDVHGPRSRAGLYRSMPIHHFLHLGTVIAALHLGSELSRMRRVNTVTCSHTNTHSHLISVHHMRIYISLDPVFSLWYIIASNTNHYLLHEKIY